MDLLLLGQFHFSEWLGVYSAGLKILGLPLGIINSLMAAIQPRLARESHDLRSDKLTVLVHHSTRLVWVLIVPAILGCWLFGEQLVLWVFGSGYSGSVIFLKPLSLVFGFFCLGQVPMQALFLSHRMKLLVQIAAVNCLSSAAIIGGLLWVGRPECVAWGMVLVQCLYMILGWLLVIGRPSFFMLLTSDEMIYLMLPAILLALPLLFLKSVGAPSQFALSAAGYILGLLLVRIWRRPWFRATLT
jgi:O-antigen/teichoic acid export membrane protein